MTATNSAETCIADITRQIEKSIRKGCVEGVIINACISSIDNAQIAIQPVPATFVSVSGSGVRWKTYGGSGGKMRK